MNAENNKPYILYTGSCWYKDVIVDVNKIVLYIRSSTRWIPNGAADPISTMYGEDTYTSITPLSEEDLFLELL